MGGGILLAKENSLSQLLAKVYPQFNWDSAHQNADIWHNKNLATYFVEWLKKQTNKEISIAEETIHSIATENSPLIQLLTTAFPKQKWLSRKTYKAQFFLKECIEAMFKGEENVLILQEYKHPDIDGLELDYFLPQYNIAFEYQVSLKV